mgnify:FL=1
MISKIGFEFIDKALYLTKQKILVVADLHIGYEEALNKEGIFVPRTQFRELVCDLEKIFKQLKKEKKKIEKIVVLGDLKHEFGEISQQEWRETKPILDLLKKKAKKVILIKGNHDTILEPIAKRKALGIRDFYIEDGICFLHGHKLFLECLDKKVKMLVVGHRHPAVVLADKYKKEKYKCFLFGKWKGKEIILMPSFFSFIIGSDILTNSNNNYLFISDKELEKFEVYVVGDKVYRFGELRSLI